MTELFKSLVVNMKRYNVDPAPFAYMDPETGEDVYDPLPYIYYYKSSLEDFVETAKEVQIPDGICNDIDVLDLNTSMLIRTNDKSLLSIDRADRCVTIYDELIEDKYLYKLIEVARKEVTQYGFPSSRLTNDLRTYFPLERVKLDTIIASAKARQKFPREEGISEVKASDFDWPDHPAEEYCTSYEVQLNARVRYALTYYWCVFGYTIECIIDNKLRYTCDMPACVARAIVTYMTEHNCYVYNLVPSR